MAELLEFLALHRKPSHLIDSPESILLSSAAGIAVVHSLIGVDHWLPFVVLGRARGWSLQKVLALTAACGAGHILTSFLLGFIGIGLGVAVADIQWIQESRGNLAAIAMIAFGLTYAAWSFARTRRKQRHAHSHATGLVHAKQDCDQGQAPTSSSDALTAGGLFLVFALGPSEPLIPLLMLPALDFGVAAAVSVGLVFGLSSIATMLAAVSVGYAGLRLPNFHGFEAHAHTLAGLTIAGSGLLIHALRF